MNIYAQFTLIAASLLVIGLDGNFLSPMNSTILENLFSKKSDVSNTTIVNTVQTNKTNNTNENTMTTTDYVYVNYAQLGYEIFKKKLAEAYEILDYFLEKEPVWIKVTKTYIVANNTENKTDHQHENIKKVRINFGNLKNQTDLPLETNTESPLQRDITPTETSVMETGTRKKFEMEHNELKTTDDPVSLYHNNEIKENKNYKPHDEIFQPQDQVFQEKVDEKVDSHVADNEVKADKGYEETQEFENQEKNKNVSEGFFTRIYHKFMNLFG